MKNTKRILSVLLLVAMVATLVACGSKSIVGTWEISLKDFFKASGAPDSYLEGVSGTMTWEFKKDGTLVMTMQATAFGETNKQSQETEYKVDGDKLIMDGGQIEFKISGKTLTITQNGQTLSFKKK